MLIWGWASAVHRRAAIHPETSKWYSLSAGADSIVLAENLVSASRHTQGSPSNTAAIWGSIAKRFTVSEGAFDCRLGKIRGTHNGFKWSVLSMVGCWGVHILLAGTRWPDHVSIAVQEIIVLSSQEEA
jgi:hypothetical protein